LGKFILGILGRVKTGVVLGTSFRAWNREMLPKNGNVLSILIAMIMEGGSLRRVKV
jgi:hypothetical protein